MRNFVLFSILPLFLVLPAGAGFVVPPLSSPVEDHAQMITSRDQQRLRDMIRLFHQNHQAQIQVLTVKDLGGVPIEQASIQVTDQWKLGDRKRDDGVLVLVAAQERKIRIEVGQGLEGLLPDALAKRLIAEVMVPAFREQSPSRGILLGVSQIMRIIDPQFAGAGPQGDFEKNKNLNSGYFTLNSFLMFFILASFILQIMLSRFRRGRRVFGGGVWVDHGSGWPGGGFGSGGSGGGGFGGWSGGGGGFSGGGASGNW